MQPTPPLADSTPDGASQETKTYTWFAVMSVFGETCCPAPDLGGSARATNHYLRNYHLKRSTDQEGPEWTEDEIVSRIERDAKLYTSGMFVAGGGLDEWAAFQAWMIISHLHPAEALMRWRMGFPWPRGSGKDPLRENIKQLNSRVERQVRAQEPGLCRE